MPTGGGLAGFVRHRDWSGDWSRTSSENESLVVVSLEAHKVYYYRYSNICNTDVYWDYSLTRLWRYG